MKKWLILLAWLLFLTSNVASAQDHAATGIHELDEIVVVSTGKTKAIDTPASISIITAEDLERMKAKNIVEVLRKIPGVDDTSSKDAAVTIRGARSSMTGGPVLLIDGVPQKIGDYRYDEFSFIPVSQIERIEVLRSAGIAYGPGAARGVINIITKQADTEDRVSFEGSASYGSWNTHDLTAGFSGKTNNWDYSVHASNYRTDGYQEDEATLNSALFKAGYTFAGQTRIGIRGNFMSREAKSPYGFEKKDWQLDNYRRNIHFPVSETDSTCWWHTEKEQDVSNIALDFSHRSGKSFLDSTLSWTGYDEVYRDLHYKNVKPANVYHDFKTQTAYAFNLSGGHHFVWAKFSYTPSLGVDYEQTDFHQERFYPNDSTKDTSKYNYKFDEKTYGLFFDHDLMFGEHWELKLGGRLDRVEVDFEDKAGTKVDQNKDMFSWQTALAYHFNPKANLYLSAGKNYWFPTPRYYAWAAEKGGDINKPEDLKPEESLTYELGYKHMLHRAFNINLTFYLNYYRDKYSSVYDYSSDKSVGLKNVGKAEGRGVEVEIDGLLGRYFGYRLAANYQEIKWKSGVMRVYEHPDNNQVYADLAGYYLNDIPKYSGVIGLDFYPVNNLTCSVDVNYTGPKYIDYLNRDEYPAKTTVDLSVSYNWKKWQFWVAGKNVLDEKIEKLINSTGELTGPNGSWDNAYYVQEGSYFEVGVKYLF